MIFVFLFLRARFLAVLIADLVTVFSLSPLFVLFVLFEDEVFFAAVFNTGAVASPSGAIQFVPSKL